MSLTINTTPNSGAGEKSKPLTPQRELTRKIVRTALQTVVNENGTLDDVAEKLPERFAHLRPDENGSKRQHVYERLQSKSAQEEMQAIAAEFDLKDLASRTKRKLSAIVDHTPTDAPSAPQAALVRTALQLTGELVEKHETLNRQTVDIDMVKALNRGDKAALLMELIRLESAGVDVSVSPAKSETGRGEETPLKSSENRQIGVEGQ